MKKTLPSVLLVLSTLVFIGCGGGSSTATATTPVTGAFIDAAVKGLGYTCSSGLQGTTDLNGEYTCNTGDTVTFFIGDLAIGTIVAQTTMITPYSLFPNDNTAALNLARLLQSLDMVPSDPDLIDLNTTLAGSISADTNLTASLNSFETDVEADLNITLISATDAQIAMNDAITNAGGSVPTDLKPVANAGKDQVVFIGSTVTLEANASIDAANYTWTAPAGITLSNTVSQNPTFTADANGTYIFGLVVDDESVDSDLDTVVVTVDNRYSRSATGIVTDRSTGLEWQDNVVSVQKPWIDTAIYGGDYYNTSGDTAATYCTELYLDGGNWRLPNIDELAGIVEGTVAPTINPVFQNIASYYYWSSTTYAVGAWGARGVEFNDGGQYNGLKGGNSSVCCVRAGQ